MIQRPMTTEEAERAEALEERRRFRREAESARAPTEPNIGPGEKMLMILVALGFDGAQVIAGPLAFVVSPAAWLTFFLWFHAKGMGSFKGFGSPAGVNVAAFGIGMIPGVNLLPERTAAILVILLRERIKLPATDHAAPPA